MKFEGPIDMRPLTVRGTFGIAWQLLRRGFASVFLYALLMQVLLLLGIFVVVSPMLASIIKGSFSGFDFVVEVIVAFLLMLVYFLAVALLFTPIYSGTLYGEFSSRFYAHGASCSLLFHRAKHSLKRYFTTALCLYVCAIAISFVQSILSGMTGGILGFAGLAAALPSAIVGGAWNGTWNWSGGNPFALLSGMGAGVVIAMVLMGLFSFAITLGASSFICLTYPVAVNESVMNFDAVGRSFKLTSKRYGRVLGCKLLYGAVLVGIEGALGILGAVVLALSMDFDAMALAPVAYGVLGVIALASIFVSILASLFTPALDTVLYYDARTRVEGRAWLGMDAAAQTQAPVDGQAGTVYEPLQQQADKNPNGGEDGA